MQTPNRRFRIPSAVIAAALVVSSFGAGIAVGVARSSTSAANFSQFFVGSGKAPEGVDLTQLWLAWELLDSRFVPTTASSTMAEDQAKIWGAIEGLTRSYGDPYTVFLPPEENKAFTESVQGSFSGVGMEIGMRDRVITVVAPLPNSPAMRAGIRTGDRVIAIDGETTEGMSVDAAVKRIRGEAGTQVKLLLAREGEDSREVTITRAQIEVPTIKTEQRDGVFIISLYNFSAPSSERFREAMRQFVESGSNRLVLDLRGNPGGFMEAAVEMASYFLPMGATVVTEDYEGKQKSEEHKSYGYNVIKARGIDLKMIVLINQGSASASEILAGALRDHGIATVMGEQSFGKGSVQELIDLGGGASLKITIAKWLTPNGTSISEKGLTPDIKVERTLEDIQNEKDPQLDEAIKHLLSR
jgi:carboxyl-terminal processing protease